MNNSNRENYLLIEYSGLALQDKAIKSYYVYVQINLVRHKHDTDTTHPKQSGVVAVDSCFAFIAARQDGTPTDRTKTLY